MQVVDALVHAGGLIGTYGDVEQVILVVDGLGIHVGITTVIGTAAGSAESAPDFRNPTSPCDPSLPDFINRSRKQPQRPRIPEIRGQVTTKRGWISGFRVSLPQGEVGFRESPFLWSQSQPTIPKHDNKMKKKRRKSPQALNNCSDFHPRHPLFRSCWRLFRRTFSNFAAK